jgi:RecA-family ATPase
LLFYVYNNYAKEGSSPDLPARIRPGQDAAGLTPAQMANIPINLMGNKWETMIRLDLK